MLDDPFVLPRPSSTYFGHGGNGSSSSAAAATASTNTAPYSLLLSGHASKFKSSGGGGAGTAARPLMVGKENGLLPSPRFGSSSSSSSAPSSSSSPPRDGESSLLRKSLKPALKRRVTFSPTPLASLQSSPSHGKRPRPPAAAGLLFTDEHEREAKRRRRRENVYSDNPLLEAARGGAAAPAPSTTSRRPFGDADNDAESASESDVRPGGDSSPPPVPSPELRLVPLPRSPPRPRTKPTSVNLGSYPTSFAPFSLVTASTVPSNPQDTADDAGAAEATDSEEESEQVESLLLPASVSPKKPSPTATRPSTSADPALVLPPKYHLLDPSATFPSLAGMSASGSSATSSSPLRSPSITLSRSARPSTSLLLPDPPLRSILKQKAPSGNFIVKDEREGLRKNGRGRRHVVGWDGEKKLKTAREKRLDEQAVKVAAAAATARDDDAAADAAGAGGKDKGKDKAKEGASASSSAPKSSSARATRSSSRAGRSAATGLGNGGGDDEPPRRRRGTGAGGSASSSSNTNGAGSAGPPPSRKRDPTRIKYELQLDDPTQLRAPLLVLRASLETLRQSHSGQDEGEAALPPIVGNGVGSSSSLLPRPLATATPLAPISTTQQQQQTTIGPTIGNILTLNDVENAYVSLKNAVFCLPSVLADEQASLEPLRTHGQALLAALTRDVENVKSFPLWVAEQPGPNSDSEDHLMIDVDAPTGDADEPSSSPSLNRRAAANPAAAVGPGAKASLTDAQMRRMRDELGTAQAAVKCAAACLRDARVVALFESADLAKLVEIVMSVALAPDLSVSVRRDFFPFLPFFLSSIAAATSAALPNLLVPTILPSLRATLTLDPRVDRFRQSLSESLDALAVLLPLHGQMMLDSQAWRLWLREATMGLWDGTKKMISTHDKAVKVLGRVVRILTVPVQTATWNVERESVHAAISRDLHNLMTSSPPGAGLDPTDVNQQRRLSYLQTLLSQIDVQASEKARAAGTDENATKQIATVSVLALVPALLGGAFRFIDPKGIGPWMRTFNTLSESPSSPVLVLSALAWPHLAFAFLRTPGQPNRPWMFRDNSTRPLFNYLSIFRSRIKGWQGVVDPTLNDERKEQIRLHAKALALAFCGAIYGAIVYVRYDTTSVRTANDPPNVPAHRLPMLDRIFKEMLEVYLPEIAKSEASHECKIIGWQILARICRPKSSSERPVSLESLINPIFLDGTLAIIAPDSAKMNVLLDAAIQRSIKPASIPGWSEHWLVTNVDSVLQLFEKCLPDDVDQDAQESLAIKQEILNAWRTLLRTLAGHPHALSQAIQWLTRLSLKEPPVASSLWTSLFAKGTEQYLSGVEAAMMTDSRALHLATQSWLAATEKRGGYAGVLAKVAGRRLAQLRAGETASQDFQTAVVLLRELAKAEAPEELAKDRFRLAESIVCLGWSSNDGPLALRERVRAALTSPDDGPSFNMRLCLMLIAGAQRLDEPVRQDVLTFCGAIALSALESDESSTNVELIASMLRCACDASYPHFYESVLEYLRSTVAPTGENLERFAPLLIEPLRRAIELATSAPDVDTQALLQASLASEAPIPAYLQLIQSFEEFWRGTFAPLEEEVDLPPDLAGLLQVVRAIVHIPDAAETAETCSSTPTDSMPVPAQVAVAVPDGYRTTASEDRVVSSRGGYEADVSRLPLQLASAPAASELEQGSTTASRHSQPRKVVSLSLQAPTAERVDAGIDSPLAVEADTQMVDETQSDVLTREANASFAAMSSRVLSQGIAEFATPEHGAQTDHARKGPNNRKRLRSSTASGSDVASSTEDSTSETSSGRKRVGKRRRNAGARRESPSSSGLAAPAAVASSARADSVLNDSQADQHDLSSTADPHDQATEDIVRSFLSLPIDTVVSVGKRLGGSPSLRRLIDLGERAREYFERMNSASS